jgi:hypothetical protein
VLLFLLFSLLSMGQIAFVAHIVSYSWRPPDRLAGPSYSREGHQRLNEKVAFPLFCTHPPLSRHELLSTLNDPEKNYCPRRAAGTYDRELITAGKSIETKYRQIRPSVCEVCG